VVGEKLDAKLDDIRGTSALLRYQQSGDCGEKGKEGGMSSEETGAK